MTLMLYIKGMVCKRCVLAVEAIFNQHHVFPETVKLGKVQLNDSLSQLQTQDITKHLESIGFEVSTDSKIYQIEKVKHVILHYIREHPQVKQKMSEYIQLETGMDYSYLSALFSKNEKLTIEKYMLHQKIEHVKMLLREQHYSLKEIAAQARFSSTAHLSAQFKNVTGQNISDYRKSF